jgi:putative ATP-dependent endonuclease of OLD family
MNPTVANPGGGGNWKSNANSIIPRSIYVKAVHDATEESISKEASSYGKIVSLIIEKKMMQRPEVVDLKNNIETVLRLFNPNPDHPEMQAPEIRDIESRINSRLNRIIGGKVSIRTSDVDIEPILLPSTYLVLKDRPEGVDTTPAHQGHGLQRTLIMTLLQILAEIQVETTPSEGERRSFGIPPRPIVLAVEEPELYMHPQMERKMRDVLYELSVQPDLQVICTTHSSVFLDVGRSQKTIVRVVKNLQGGCQFHQVIHDIFAGPEADAERERLQLVKAFNPAINEMFFARRVVLLEEYSAVVAFERSAELTGLFQRHRHLRRDVTLIDCQGKHNIPMFQRVLNHFGIPYTVIHDLDAGNATEEAINARIAGLLGSNQCHAITPTNLEGLLGYAAGKDKPYKSLKRVEELHGTGGLPDGFVIALNWVYFGQDAEPAVQAPD